MNSQRAEIASQLSALASTLAAPMPADAAGDGWTPETWSNWRAKFDALAQEAHGFGDLPVASIARALDHDGIVGGLILERAATVSNALRALNGNR